MRAADVHGLGARRFGVGAFDEAYAIAIDQGDAMPGREPRVRGPEQMNADLVRYARLRMNREPKRLGEEGREEVAPRAAPAEDFDRARARLLPHLRAARVGRERDRVFE